MSDLIDKLCLASREHQASDLFLHENRLPLVRISGQLTELGEAPITPGDLDPFWDACGADASTRDLDVGFVASDGGRFRVNLFRHMGARGAVLRQIKTDIPPLDTLGLPHELLQTWLQQQSGLILVSGPTGSGKSTTLASCLQFLNQTASRHVVTIEDPIEYYFTDTLCRFTQREVGTDTDSFAEGLRRSLRQSPDVIFLGEIRDTPSALTALQAAETGHLVMATLHSSSAAESAERLSRLFPSDERESALALLSRQLLGILCQRLLTSTSGTSTLVVEYFENQGSSRKWIQEGQFKELADLLARNDIPHAQSFLAGLVQACKAGLITEETALAATSNPQEFQRMMRGISSGSTRR